MVQNFLEINTFPKICCNSGMDVCRYSCLTPKELRDYAGAKAHLWGWVVSDVKDYHKFRKLLDYDISRPPQSWMYLKGDE